MSIRYSFSKSRVRKRCLTIDVMLQCGRGIPQHEVRDAVRTGERITFQREPGNLDGTL